MSIREQLLAAIATALAPVPGAVVYRSREAAFTRNDGVAILVRPDEEIVENRGSLAAFRSFRVLITVIARAAIPDQTADPVIAAMHAALMADTTLGGKCRSIIEEETKWDFEVADQSAVAAAVRYRLVYSTPISTLSTAN